MVEHTENCKKAQAAVEAFKAAHPDHCKTCGGHGSNGQPSDPSVGLYDPEPCEDCIGQGRCPVCGHQHDEEWDGEACEACGWNWDPKLSVVSAPWHECECGMDWQPDQAEIDFQRKAAEEVAEAKWVAMSPEERDTWYAASDFAYDAWRETGRRS